GVRLMQMDGRDIPYEDEFDAIGAFDVLEHIEDDDRVLAEMHRALVAGGGLIATVPQHPWLWSGVDDYARHYRRYTRRQFAAKLQAAGFSVERVTSFMTLILPALLAARLSTPDASRLDPGGELKIGRFVNRVCGFLCACERPLIAAGVSLPLGGSLLAVARKRS